MKNVFKKMFEIKKSINILYYKMIYIIRFLYELVRCKELVIELRYFSKVTQLGKGLYRLRRLLHLNLCLILAGII